MKPHSNLIALFAGLSSLSIGGVLLGQQPPGVPSGVVPAAIPSPAMTYSPGRTIPIRPDSKRPLLLKEEERNPYADRSPDQQAVADGGDNAEEMEIRSALSSLSVTGQSRGPNGLRILLGDIILEKGRRLPPLLPDQSEALEVVEVSEDSVVLAWLDIESGEPTGKTMQMAYDLTPSVAYALHGQPKGQGDQEGTPDLRMGLMRVNQERKRAESRMADKDAGKERPEGVSQAGQ